MKEFFLHIATYSLFIAVVLAGSWVRFKWRSRHVTDLDREPDAHDEYLFDVLEAKADAFWDLCGEAATQYWSWPWRIAAGLVVGIMIVASFSPVWLNRNAVVLGEDYAVSLDYFNVAPMPLLLWAAFLILCANIYSRKDPKTVGVLGLCSSANGEDPAENLSNACLEFFTRIRLREVETADDISFDAFYRARVWRLRRGSIAMSVLLLAATASVAVLDARYMRTVTHNGLTTSGPYFGAGTQKTLAWSDVDYTKVELRPGGFDYVVYGADGGRTAFKLTPNTLRSVLTIDRHAEAGGVVRRSLSSSVDEALDRCRRRGYNDMQLSAVRYLLSEGQ